MSNMKRNRFDRQDVVTPNICPTTVGGGTRSPLSIYRKQFEASLCVETSLGNKLCNIAKLFNITHVMLYLEYKYLGADGCDPQLKQTSPLLSSSTNYFYMTSACRLSRQLSLYTELFPLWRLLQSSRHIHQR